MKHYLRNIFTFSLLLGSLWMVLELAVPQQLISFRNWEPFCITDYSKFIGPWIPNKTLTRDETGDMGHHTDRAIIKKDIRWTTDELGYRNDKYIKDPDIIFIGASNMLGCAMDQESFLGPVLGRMMNRTTYTMAPTHFNKMARLISNDFFEKPDIIVYGCMERLIQDFHKLNKKYINSKIKNKERFSNKWYNLYHKTRERINKKLFKNYLKARANGSGGYGVPSPVDPNMVIFKNNNDLVKVTQDEIVKHSKIITQYYKYSKKLGVKFIFFPIPNKGTVYYETIPLENQPDYLSKLFVELKKRKVPHINTLNLFNKHKENELLYHYDDSHWNEAATALVAKELFSLIGKLEKRARKKKYN